MKSQHDIYGVYVETKPGAHKELRWKKWAESVELDLASLGKNALYKEIAASRKWPSDDFEALLAFLGIERVQPAPTPPAPVFRFKKSGRKK